MYQRILPPTQASRGRTHCPPRHCIVGLLLLLLLLLLHGRLCSALSESTKTTHPEAVQGDRVLQLHCRLAQELWALRHATTTDLAIRSGRPEGCLLHIADTHVGALGWGSIPVVPSPVLGHASSTPVCGVLFPPSSGSVQWKGTILPHLSFQEVMTSAWDAETPVLCETGAFAPGRAVSQAEVIETDTPADSDLQPASGGSTSLDNDDK